MLTVKPFRAVRPASDLAEKVSSLPYDVMNTEEAREMAKGNDVSFLHVIRSEIDLPPETDPHSEEVYQKAAENLDRFLANKTLIKDQKPCLYVYSQTMNGRTQTGIAALVSIDDYENGRVKKHEFTLPAKEEDRIQNFLACNAHTEPIFLINKENKTIQSEMDAVMKHEPQYSFTSEDGISHVLWVIDDDGMIDRIIKAYDAMDALYIADGHHRAASSYRVGKRLREAFPNAPADAEFNYIMAVIFPENELQIMDYNRLLMDTGIDNPEQFLRKLSDDFVVTSIVSDDCKTKQKHTFSMFLDGSWYALTAKDGTFDANDPVASLDASILQKNVFDKILGIDDPRTTDRLQFVGGIRGYESLQNSVDAGKAAAAFALYPVSIRDLISVADSGLVMPPKSTWFEPKLRSGLFLHQL